MNTAKLAGVVSHDGKNSVQWEAVVPIATNPFILAELLQTSLIGAGVALSIMATGVWFWGGGLHPGDVGLMLGGAAVFFVAVSCVFLFLGFVLFRNRYFALYHLTPGGIYHQAVRGRDESGSPFLLGMRPLPVVGAVTGKKPREKDLPWEKVDRFVEFESMRSVQLKRGRWSMLRLYTPDPATHARVVAYLAARLTRVED